MRTGTALVFSSTPAAFAAPGDSIKRTAPVERQEYADESGRSATDRLACNGTFRSVDPIPWRINNVIQDHASDIDRADHTTDEKQVVDSIR